MNYKELFKRYKLGAVNEEEKQIVEEEIEKYEALEDYISDSINENFEDDLNPSSFDFQFDETKKLKKNVSNRLKKVVLTSVLIVVALYFTVFYVISAMVDAAYYDPSATSQSVDDDYPRANFYYDMQAYVSLNMPGYAMNSFTSQESERFGKYEVSYSLGNLFTGNEQRHFIDISRGRLTEAFDGIFSSDNRFGIWNGFDTIKVDNNSNNETNTIIESETVQNQNDKTIEYLNELNPLSYVSMSIVFDSDYSMEAFYNMQEEHSTLDFKWVGVRTVTPGEKWSDTQPMHLIGFNPNRNDEPSSNARPNPGKYPLFYLMDAENHSDFRQLDYPNRMIESYKMHFESRLRYLRDREEYVSLFDYNSYKTEFYNDALDYIDEQGVNTYGVLVFGTAEDFLEQLDDMPYESLYINEVLPARPNIY